MLQETIEWRDGRVLHVTRRVLPRDDPHAQPLWARLQAKLDGEAAPSEDKVAAPRKQQAAQPPAWSHAIAKPMTRSNKGLLVVGA